MKRMMVLIALFGFLFFGIGNIDAQQASIDTNTVNGWRVTGYSKAYSFSMGFSPIHYDGNTSQIFALSVSDTSGYVRVEKHLTTPMPKPEAMDLAENIVNSSPWSPYISVGAIIYFAHGDTVESLLDWGSNAAPDWYEVGATTGKLSISEVDRIIFQFNFGNYGVPNVVFYSGELLLDRMRFWYRHPDGSYSPTVIDSFEGTVTGINGNNSKVPQTFSLSQNYPNPFNPSTVIRYQVSEASKVTLKIYDILGREVAVLVKNGEKPAGTYEVTFNASTLSSGTYFYRLEAISPTGEFVQTKKMLLMK